MNKKKLGVRKMVKFLSGLQRQKNQGRRAMGLQGLEVRERWFWRRERNGFVGLRERKRGREIRWVWTAMGDGEENFAEKLGFIVCG